MKRRAAILAVLIATLLILGVTTVLAAPRGTAVDPDWHEQMHTSEQMQSMHLQMAGGQQADCDRIHAQMGSMHAGMGQMMDRSRGPQGR